MNIRHDAPTTDSPRPSFSGHFRPSNRPLKVALVHDWLTGLRGGEKCLERLCLLFPDATIHTLIHSPGKVGPIIGGMKIRSSPLRHLPRVDRYYRHFLPVMPWAIRQIDVGQVDLVISLSHCVAKAVRVPAGVPHLCYCFTPMRYAWDGRQAYLEKWREGSIKRRLIEALLDSLARWDLAHSAGVTQFIAISRTIRDRIQNNYGRKSMIVYPPVDTDFYTPDPSVVRDDYYLAASALVPYKKIDQAITACNRLGRRLKVIGSGPEMNRLKAMAGPTVEILGFQPDEVLRDHLRQCRALIFPGDEDFGIVPIESLACGTPVIAFDRGGVAESVDSSVGEVYPEQSVESLSEAILRFEQKPFDISLSNQARARAEAFAREVFDESMLRLIEEATEISKTEVILP
ncbi:MAG: glycosyltransferase [bacterium]